MGAEIDSLYINIDAQAVKANDAIDRLSVKLDRLSTSLERVDGSKLSGLANGVQRLGNAMQIMNNVKTADFTRLANNLQKLSAIDTASINKAASAVTQISKSFGALSGLSKSAEQLGQLATGIKQLGYSSASKAIENIPKLAIAMKELMTTLSTAPKVSQNLINMTNALAKLARTGASSGKAANSLASSLNSYTSSSDRASKSSFSLASAIGKVYATYWLLLRAFGKIKDAIDISSDLTEVQNVVDTTFGNMAYKVENLADVSIEQFGMSELALKQYASRFQAMGSAMGINKSLISSSNKYLNKQTDGYVGLSDSMSDVSLNLTKLTADMASFYNMEQADVAEDLESIFTGQTRPLRTYGLDLTEATLKEWAMKQGLDANIDSMSQAEKTMLRYQYVLSNTGAAQGDFARTADTWANQTRILKQNLEQLAAVIGGTLINALKPFVKALNVAMGYVISFAKTISNALGKIFGWTFEEGVGGIATDMEDAADGAGDLSDNLGKAVGNAKKLKTITLGIDELNINVPDDDASGTASGGLSGTGGAVSAAGTLGGQWKQGESILKKFESEINNLFKLGEYVGDTLANTLNSIPWEKVYEGARNFGTGLADFLNGLISPNLFRSVGTTIASALNTAIYASLSFGQTFDFYELGFSIATGINNFFATFDFASLAENINVWVQGIWTTIKTAIDKIDWDEVYEGIKEFLDNIDIGTIGIIIGAITVKKILALHGLKLVKDFIIGKIAGLLSQGLAINVPSITVGGATLFGGSILKTLGGIGLVIGGAVAAVKSFFDMWKKGWSKLSEIIKDIGLAVLAVGAIILGVPAGIAAGVALAVGAVSTVIIFIKDNIDDIKAWISDFISASKKVIKEFTDGVYSFFKGAWEGIKKVFSAVKDFFKNVFESAYESVKEAFQNISDWFQEKWNTVKNVFRDVKEFFKEKFTSAYRNVREAFNGINSWFQGKWDAVKGVFKDVVSFFKNKFESAYTNIRNVFSGINTWFHNKWTEVKNVFSDTISFFREKFDSAYTSIRNAFGGINSWFQGKWEDVKGVFSDVKGFFGDAFRNAYNAVTEVWDGIKGYFTDIANKIVEPIGKAVNGVIGGINWILEKVGVAQLGPWPVPEFASGSNGLPKDTLGVVNDQKGAVYKEMIVPPHGKPFIPEGRNVVLPMEKGTKIMPANQTKALLSMPRFEGGIGDFFGGLWEKAKDFTGNIFDYLTNPRKIVQIAIDKFVDIAGLSGIFFDMAKGTVSTVFDGVVSYIKGIFDDQTTANYIPGAGVEQWRELAAVALQMTGQWSEANVNRLLNQMRHESGGDPNAINDWDINAKKGTPSKGLMQVIDPTFRSYAYPGYGSNIYDPLSNMLAAIRYTVSRYGSLYAGWEARGYKGYENGIGKIRWSDLIPAYSVGGFPEDGLFMANHDEIIGQFNNGKPAVVNNYQIEAGIEEAAYRGFSRANAENRRQEALLEELISAVREGKRIVVDGRELVSIVDSRKSRNGFSFT